jgi:hypothetical protein
MLKYPRLLYGLLLLAFSLLISCGGDDEPAITPADDLSPGQMSYSVDGQLRPVSMAQAMVINTPDLTISIGGASTEDAIAVGVVRPRTFTGVFQLRSDVVGGASNVAMANYTLLNSQTYYTSLNCAALGFVEITEHNSEAKTFTGNFEVEVCHEGDRKKIVGSFREAPYL